jgi:DNA-binding Xre family transcriptional regulator
MGVNLKISYLKLWHMLLDKGMTKRDLKNVAGISTASIAKMGKGENIQTDVLLRICSALDVGITEIMDTVPVSVQTDDSEAKSDSGKAN